jgi:hypothetical protein
MRTDLLSMVAGVALCLVLGVAAFYWAVSPAQPEGTKKVQTQQTSETFGPFDEANAKLLGRPPKPQSNPLRRR